MKDYFYLLLRPTVSRRCLRRASASRVLAVFFTGFFRLADLALVVSADRHAVCVYIKICSDRAAAVVVSRQRYDVGRAECVRVSCELALVWRAAVVVDAVRISSAFRHFAASLVADFVRSAAILAARTFIISSAVDKHERLFSILLISGYTAFKVAAFIAKVLCPFLFCLLLCL